MSATEILKKIHSDAQAEVARIETQSATDVAALEREAGTIQKDLEATFQATRDRLVTRDREEIVAQAQHTAQIELQREKRVAVDAVLSAVFAKLAAEADDTYRERYQSILQSLSLASVTVQRAETAPERVAITAELLATAGITAPVEPNQSISGGMRIITSAQQFDCTLDCSFAAVRPQLEIEAARTLFAQ